MSGVLSYIESHIPTVIGSYHEFYVNNDTVMNLVLSLMKLNKIKMVGGMHTVSNYDNIQKNDFVYMNPPHYSIGSREDGYIKLAQLCSHINSKGAHFLLCNSDTGFIYKLFAEYHIDIIPGSQVLIWNF